MPHATPSDQTRIFIDSTALGATMTMNTLDRILHSAGVKAQCFEMAGRAGIDCRTLDLLEVATILRENGII